MKRFLLLCIGLVVSYAFIYPLALKIIGYYPFGVGWKVAEKIVEKGGSALDCRKIIYPFAMPLSPSPGEQRTNCIYEYAKLTKDPSACKLLMPSSYGADCVGAAMDHRLCITGEGPENTVRGQGKVTTYDACISGDAATKEYPCCVMARILEGKDEPRECASLKTPELRDECHYLLAQTTRDGNQCGMIVSERTRVGCEVLVNEYKARNPASHSSQ